MLHRAAGELSAKRAEGAFKPPAPLALLETVRGTRRIAAVSLEAARLRLYPGQKATDAQRRGEKPDPEDEMGSPNPM